MRCLAPDPYAEPAWVGSLRRLAVDTTHLLAQLEAEVLSRPFTEVASATLDLAVRLAEDAHELLRRVTP